MVTNYDTTPLFAALADGTRRRILEQVANGPMPVHRLAACFDISRPAVSRHLRVLREAGWVDMSTAGRENVYRLRTAPVRELETWLNGLWANRLAALKTLAEEAHDE